jgi:hypothetical protein
VPRGVFLVAGILMETPIGMTPSWLSLGRELLSIS